jgi:hypothetical protein
MRWKRSHAIPLITVLLLIQFADTRSRKIYSAEPQGDPYTAALAIARTLHLLPHQPLKAEHKS